MNINGTLVVWISPASVDYDGSQTAQYLLLPYLIFQPNWAWGVLCFFQLLQSNSLPEAV
jgi:hypothetical protein